MFSHSNQPEKKQADYREICFLLNRYNPANGSYNRLGAMNMESLFARHTTVHSSRCDSVTSIADRLGFVAINDDADSIGCRSTPDSSDFVQITRSEDSEDSLESRFKKTSDFREWQISIQHQMGGSVLVLISKKDSSSISKAEVNQCTRFMVENHYMDEPVNTNEEAVNDTSNTLKK